MPGGLNLPSSAIISWPAPNYVDPATHGLGLVVVGLLFSAIGVAVISARLWSRLLISRSPGLDDLLVVLALVFAIALCVLVIIADKVYDGGRHVWDIPTTSFPGGRLNAWCSEWCYVIASCCVRMSVLLYCRRLSLTFSRPFLIATWVGIIYNICYMVGFLLSLLLLCQPLGAYWLAFDPQWLAAGHRYKCGDEAIRLLLSGALGALGDLYATVLPLCLFTYLGLPRRQRWAAYALFAAGFVVVGAGVARTVLLHNATSGTYDLAWSMWTMWVWSMVELFVAICAASAPTLHPLFRRITFPRFSMRPFACSRRRGHDGDYRCGSEKSFRDGWKRLWRSDGSTQRTTDVSPDVEGTRIGIAIGGGDGEKREHAELRAVGDWGLFPKNGDVPADEPHGRGSEWILPLSEIHAHFPLRSNRTEIEELPTLPYAGRPRLVNVRVVHRPSTSGASAESRTPSQPQQGVGRPATAPSPSASRTNLRGTKIERTLGMEEQSDLAPPPPPRLPSITLPSRPPRHRTRRAEAFRAESMLDSASEDEPEADEYDDDQNSTDNDNNNNNSRPCSPTRHTDRHRNRHRSRSRNLPLWNTYLNRSISSSLTGRGAGTGNSSSANSSVETLHLPRQGSSD